MEYSLYKLNKKTRIAKLTSTEFIDKLNLIGFEVDAVCLEELSTNKFITDKKLLIKIPANREDLSNEKLFLKDVSLLFLIKINDIWDKLKNKYSFILKNEYSKSEKPITGIIDQQNLNTLIYKVDFQINLKKESPLWIKNKLISSGIPPKNFINDILNLVLLEFGSNFDISFSSFNKNENKGKLKIEIVYDNQLEVSIRGKNNNLPSGNLVLKDENNQIINSFGVFNSSFEKNKVNTIFLNDSGIFPKTEVLSLTFVFNSAFDDRNKLDKSNLKLILPHLRKTFIQNVRISFQRILTLLNILGKTKILNIYSTGNSNLILKPHKILTLNKTFFSKILSLENYDLKIFEKAGLKLVCETNKTLYFDIPRVRKDLEREIDLIEEYSRFVGYKNFKEILPIKNKFKTQKNLTNYNFIQNFFLNYGFNEIFTNSIQDKKQQRNQIEITNPLNQDFSALRTSIFPELFKIFEINLKLNISNLSFFEMGRIFKIVDKKIIEQDKLSGIFQFKLLKNSTQESYNWLVIKGFFELFLSNFNYKNLIFEKLEKNNLYFHPTRSVVIKNNNKILGTFGEINPTIGELESSKLPIYVFDFNLNHFKTYRMRQEIPSVNDYSKYPSIRKDISFIINKNENFSSIKNNIKKMSQQLKNLDFFDIYFDESLSTDKIKVGVCLKFQSLTETLTNDLIEMEISSIKQGIKDLYNIDFGA